MSKQELKGETVAEIKSHLRQEKDVVGLWSNLEGRDDRKFYNNIVAENKDGSAFKITLPRDGGQAETVEGKISHRRGKLGPARRVTIFKDGKGNETVLGRREF